MPELTGISLSGGGLRSASFALGALQTLQEQKGLLRGSKAAHWISVVSGGSYIGATLTLLNAGARARYCDGSSVGGIDLPKGRAPLEPGSPEADHLVRHCRYLVDDGGLSTSLKVLFLLLASFVTLGIVISYLGIMGLGTVGFVGRLGWRIVAPPTISTTWQWVVGLSGLAWFTLGAVTLRISRGRSRMNKGLALGAYAVGSLILFYCTPFLMESLRKTSVFSSPAWAWQHVWGILALVGGIAVGSWLLHRLGELPGLGLLKFAAVALWVMMTWLAPWIVLVALVTWAGVAFYSFSEAVMFTDVSNVSFLGWFVIYFGIQVAATIVLPLPGTISPHRPYMEMLSRCFAVVRDSGSSVRSVSRPGEIALSSLLPPTDNGRNRYPELVICAAANVVDRGVALAGSNCVPLIITGSTVGVSKQGEPSMKTSDLERIVAPQSWLKRWVTQLPVVSLMSSVAVTGAAVSPTMGKLTRPRLRPLLAALNVRLGVWLPNPLSSKARDWVAEGRSDKFDVGVFQLIWEFLGRNSAKESLVYASDGGHYENLGVVELIRRRCSIIWCIDASADGLGRATSLADAILLAEAETGCNVDLDLTALEREPGSHRLRSSYVSGEILYKDNTMGAIHVVKIGLTNKHSGVLREYEHHDPGFPFHSTIRQVYTAERFQAYRRLGWESTNMLLDEMDGPRNQKREDPDARD
jgi:hypothetical protein